MKEYLVKYEGESYSNLGYFFLAKDNIKPIKIENSSLPTSIDIISELEETDDSLVLRIGNVIFDVIEEDGVFKEVFDDSKTISFSKTELRAVGNKFDESLVDLLDIKNDLCRPNILLFVSKIISLNDNLKRYFDLVPNYLFNPKDSIFIMNLFNMIIFNLPEFEKIINSNNENFLKNNLGNKSFEISEANKLHQVVGLPKFAINLIKEMKLEEFVDSFKDLSNVVDGNSLNIILTFLQRGKLLFDANCVGKGKDYKVLKMKSFLTYLTKILSRKTYKVTDLLNYFIRQSMYYSNAGYFTFPIDEAMYLSDYLDMCEKYGLKAEKYPSQLKRQHDIIAHNVIALEKDSEVLAEEFKKAVDSYRIAEREIEVSEVIDGVKIPRKYTFLVPRTVKDIVNEGNEMHHCVGSYGDKIIDGTARIVFMRNSDDLKTSLVTIDIDEDFNLVEAKKAFNEDVDDIQMKAIKKWLKNIKEEI